MIKGARKIGECSGYGLDVKLVGPAPNIGNRNWAERVVLAVDAFPFPEIDPFEVVAFV